MVSNPRIDDLRKRLEKDPGSRLFAQLAEELRKAGDLPEAVRVCREGLLRNPAYPSARMTLGRALLDSGDLKNARAEFEAVLGGAPDNILASRFVAECLEGAGDYAGAVARYRATLAMAPEDKQITARLRAAEARLNQGPSSEGVTGAAAPGEEKAALPEVEASEAPIPLVAVDEAFELERPYESPAIATGPGAGESPSFDATLPAAARPGPPRPAEDFFEFEGPNAPLARPERLPPPEPPRGAVEPPRVLIPAEGEPRPPWVEPQAPPPGAADSGATAGPELASSTLAELYFNQGFTDKAVEVYRQLVAQDPGNERASARLKELQGIERHLRGEERAPAPPGATADSRESRRRAVERTIARLEEMRVALRRE